MKLAPCILFTIGILQLAFFEKTRASEEYRKGTYRPDLILTDVDCRLTGAFVTAPKNSVTVDASTPGLMTCIRGKGKALECLHHSNRSDGTTEQTKTSYAIADEIDSMLIFKSVPTGNITYLVNKADKRFAMGMTSVISPGGIVAKVCSGTFQDQTKIK